MTRMLRWWACAISFVLGFSLLVIATGRLVDLVSAPTLTELFLAGAVLLAISVGLWLYQDSTQSVELPDDTSREEPECFELMAPRRHGD